MFLIGLTGGIASGKSTVCAMIKEAGVPVVDADTIARQVVEVGTPAYKEIVKHFGDEVLQEDGSIDRGKLGAAVFSDEGKRKLINSITHPRIYAEMRSQAFRHFLALEQFVVLDLPLLYESGYALPFMAKTVVVTCTPEQQQERLQARGGYTELQARARIEAQWPLADKAGQADYVIENSSSRGYTREQTEAIVRALRSSNRHLVNRALLMACLVGVLMLLLWLARLIF